MRDTPARSSRDEASRALPSGAGGGFEELTLTPATPWARVAAAPSWLRILLWAGGALVLAWSVVYLTWPMSLDQGILAWVGDVIRHGGFAYRDAFELRGPAPFYAYAALSAIFRRAEWALRALDLVILAVGATALARIARRFVDWPGAALGSLLFVLWYAALDFHNTAQSDGWNGAALAACVALLLRDSSRAKLLHAALAGVLIGLCVLSKPTYLVFLGLGPLYAGYRVVARESTLRSAALEVFAFGAGAALTIASLLAYYARAGALRDLLDVHVMFTASVYAQLDVAWLNRIQFVVKYISAGQFAIAFAFAATGFVVAWRRQRAATLLVAAWLAGTLLTVIVQGKFWPYHWLPMYAPLALLASLGVVGVAASIGAQAASLPRALIAGATVLMFAGPVVDAFMHVYRAAIMAAVPGSRERLERVEFDVFGKRTGVMHRLATRVRGVSRNDETLLAWGNAAPIHFLADRRAPTRFGYPSILLRIPDSDFRRRYRSEFLAGLTRHPPDLILLRAERLCPENDRTKPEFAQPGEEDAEWLFMCRRDLRGIGGPTLERYDLVFEESGIELLRRRTSSTAPSAPRTDGS